MLPPSAGSVLDWTTIFVGDFFFFSERFAILQADILCMTVASALVPMAQMKPSSSRRPPRQSSSCLYTWDDTENFPANNSVSVFGNVSDDGSTAHVVFG